MAKQLYFNKIYKKDLQSCHCFVKTLKTHILSQRVSVFNIWPLPLFLPATLGFSQTTYSSAASLLWLGKQHSLFEIWPTHPLVTLGLQDWQSFWDFWVFLSFALSLPMYTARVVVSRSQDYSSQEPLHYQRMSSLTFWASHACEPMLPRPL